MVILLLFFFLFVCARVLGAYTVTALQTCCSFALLRESKTQCHNRLFFLESCIAFRSRVIVSRWRCFPKSGIVFLPASELLATIRDGLPHPPPLPSSRSGSSKKLGSGGTNGRSGHRHPATNIIHTLFLLLLNYSEILVFESQCVTPGVGLDYK